MAESVTWSAGNCVGNTLARPEGGIKMKTYHLPKNDYEEMVKLDILPSKITGSLRTIRREGSDKGISATLWNDYKKRVELNVKPSTFKKY